MLDARWWLISYDVHDARRLRRAATILEGAGQRIQYSVFRCWMTPGQMEELRWELTQTLDPSDEVLLIPLCPRCVAGMQTIHSSQNLPDWPSQPAGFRIV